MSSDSAEPIKIGYVRQVETPGVGRREYLVVRHSHLVDRFGEE